MKCEDCRFWRRPGPFAQRGECSIELPPFIEADYSSAMTWAHEGCSLGKPTFMSLHPEEE